MEGTSELAHVSIPGFIWGPWEFIMRASCAKFQFDPFVSRSFGTESSDGSNGRKLAITPWRRAKITLHVGPRSSLVPGSLVMKI
eukprot:scaffold85724_cov50-Attheya_sp.AAC.14